MDWTHPVGAVECTGGPQPAALQLQAALLDRWGSRGASSLGIYNCRPIGGTSTLSVHAEGRAFDCGIAPSVRPGLGDDVLASLLAFDGVLLQRIIWNRRLYDEASPAGRAYYGESTHEDHLHIELAWSVCPGLSDEALQQLLGEDDDMATPVQGLLVAWNGAQWCVSPDLSSKTGLHQGSDVEALQALGGYVPTTLSAGTMEAIPQR